MSGIRQRKKRKQRTVRRINGKINAKKKQNRKKKTDNNNDENHLSQKDLLIAINLAENAAKSGESHFVTPSMDELRQSQLEISVEDTHVPSKQVKHSKSRNNNNSNKIKLSSVVEIKEDHEEEEEEKEEIIEETKRSVNISDDDIYSSLEKREEEDEDDSKKNDSTEIIRQQPSFAEISYGNDSPEKKSITESIQKNSKLLHSIHLTETPTKKKQVRKRNNVDILLSPPTFMSCDDIFKSGDFWNIDSDEDNDDIIQESQEKAKKIVPREPKKIIVPEETSKISFIEAEIGRFSFRSKSRLRTSSESSVGYYSDDERRIRKLSTQQRLEEEEELRQGKEPYSPKSGLLLSRIPSFGYTSVASEDGGGYGGGYLFSPPVNRRRPRPERPESPWLIPADHSWKVFWDLSTVVVSVIVAYHSHKKVSTRSFGEYDSFISILGDAWFLLDILLNFVSQIKTGDGIVYKDYKSVWARYLTTWFAIDVVSIIPWERYYVKPIVEIQKRRNIFKKAFLKAGKVVKVTARFARKRHVKAFGKVAKTTKKTAGVGGRKLLKYIIKYVPKYVFFYRRMKAVIVLRILRQVHHLRKMIKALSSSSSSSSPPSIRTTMISLPTAPATPPHTSTQIKSEWMTPELKTEGVMTKNNHEETSINTSSEEETITVSSSSYQSL